MSLSPRTEVKVRNPTSGCVGKYTVVDKCFAFVHSSSKCCGCNALKDAQGRHLVTLSNGLPGFIDEIRADLTQQIRRSGTACVLRDVTAACTILRICVGLEIIEGLKGKKAGAMGRLLSLPHLGSPGA